MSFCARAQRLPKVMDSAPSTARSVVISRPGFKSAARRTSTTAAPSLGRVAAKPAVSLLAPWYTSGHQKWKGNRASLKNMPPMNSDRPTTAMGWPSQVQVRCASWAM